jgi:cytochrome P450
VSTAITIDLTDAGLWARPDIGDLIAGLRARAPVQRLDTAQDGPVWSVLAYAPASAVLTDAATFSSTGGSLLGTGGSPAGANRMMALSDGRRHRELRTPVLPYFSPKAVRGSTERIRELAAAVVGTAVERGAVDLVEVVATIPLVIMCDLLDIADADRETVVQVCDAAFLGTTPQSRRAAHQKLIPYLFEQAMRRRAAPGADLISTLATHRIHGRLLPIEDVVLNLDNIIVGGVQTVRHTAAMSIWALLRHPDALQALRSGTCDLDTAVDELLRYTSVGLHVLRTATHDTELCGERIRAGDRVAVWTWAADHDPAVFDAPHELRLDRTPNRHLALGVGPHYCVGAPLAKAELGAIFTTLLERTSAIEVTGEPVPNQSIINFGLDHLRVVLHAR